MPKLNEYLGGLVSEITSARKLADLQTVQIAQEYAQNNLLKHFSIPRMRIGNVDLTIPIANATAVAHMKFHEFVYDEIIKVAGSDYNASDLENDQKLKNFLLEYEKYYNDRISEINQLLPDDIDGYDSQLDGLGHDLSKRILGFCTSLSNFYWKYVSQDVLFQNIHRRIVNESKNISTTSSNSDQEVIVDAATLMTLDPKCITYIKMTVTETAMEWSRYEDINGNVVETLMPE